MRRCLPYTFMALGLLLLAPGCGGEKDSTDPSSAIIEPAPGPGGIGPAPPPTPVVQINPFRRPGRGDPVVLGVTLSSTGTNVYSKGSGATETRVEIDGVSAGGQAVGTASVPFTPATGGIVWGDGVHSIDLAAAANLIGKSEKVAFKVFINVTPPSPAVPFVISASATFTL